MKLSKTKPDIKQPLCDYLIRKAVADHFEFVPCGKPGQICNSGPAWQNGFTRCPKHTKI